MLPIVISPDPILATVCEPCEPGDKSLKRLSKQMAHAMYKNYGCGIAAPQVGVTKRLVVIDVDWDGEKGEKNPIVLVNPEIVELAGEPEEGGEGCLSCPGVTVPVKRQPWARRPVLRFGRRVVGDRGRRPARPLPAARDRPLERQDALRELRSGDPHRGAARLRGGPRPPAPTRATPISR